MDDYTDDFDDDFDDDDFCDDGDYADDDFDDPLEVDDDGWDGEYCEEDGPVSDDDFSVEGDDSHFTWKEAMFIGGVLGSAYEEWLEDRKRRKAMKRKRRQDTPCH